MTTFDISITDISRFFAVTMGKTGFQLFEKLQSLQAVYGVRTDTYEIFPLLTLEQVGKKLRVSSQYMHSTWTTMLAQRGKRKRRYFTELAHVDLVAERNKAAALIVIELVRLIVTAGSQGKPNIQLYTLEKYVPQLRVIRESARPNKLKNRDLKRIFSRVYPLLESKTELGRTFVDFETKKLIPTVEQFNESIRVHHQGYRQLDWRLLK
ncbi:hypothetical protein C7445_1271 [Alicyclobacillus sacchari]|uniref:Uncharacterized protein n=1 Tax=Alicyclobacillus sacchari TaxID=392010 RepID=A0A4R8L9X9_9BACL|nr:hypothetical protein [Alicyclobacillus sacchari]TDY38988.1 hypothetical protein C7445_1271 [Alicyclobacillus sacchari]GMA58075.1 hypothetical protein GCM10025858_25780 [Alicyclobacillus sacchari]